MISRTLDNMVNCEGNVSRTKTSGTGARLQVLFQGLMLPQHLAKSWHHLSQLLHQHCRDITGVSKAS